MQRMGASRGFTIVELLIVIVVIGILAAIVIVAYNGIQNQAHDSAIKSDLRNLAGQIQQYSVASTGGQLPDDDTDFFDSQMGTLKVSRNSYGNALDTGGGTLWNLVYCIPNSTNPHDFALVAASKSGKKFAYTKGSVTEYTGTFGPDSATICTNVGISPFNDRVWFFEANDWRGFVKE